MKQLLALKDCCKIPKSRRVQNLTPALTLINELVKFLTQRRVRGFSTIFLILLVLITACKEEVKQTETVKTAPKEEILVEIQNGIYTEWYPGKEHIKYKGGQDEEKRRHGIWTFYSEEGKELSLTMYDHGLREGFTVVKYPTGALHYRGEYRRDTTVGVWTTYNEKGEFLSETDFGYPEE